MGAGASKLIASVLFAGDAGVRNAENLTGTYNPAPNEDGRGGTSFSTVKSVAVAQREETANTARGLVSEPENSNENPAANTVVFGETGVGKSSIINLIANEMLARTSNDAVGCTFRYDRYSVALSGVSCTLWDTVGLDEGSEGTVPAEEAERNLNTLMLELAHSGGIQLIIYCIRGTRLTRALKRNYDLFYGVACRRKVPVALVVTGLEHQQGGMESWWTENEAELRRNGMWFDAHACVTTLNVMDDDIQQRRTESQTMLCGLVVKYSTLPAWKADSSFLLPILPLLHNASRGTYYPTRAGGTAVRRKVIMCGSCSTFPRRSTPTRYGLVRVDKNALDTIKPRMRDGVGLLLFCSSVLVEDRMSRLDVEALKKFYDLAGGLSRPVIVALEGCKDDQVALECQAEVASRYKDIQAHFVAMPGSDDAGAKLDEMIGILYLEQAGFAPFKRLTCP